MRYIGYFFLMIIGIPIGIVILVFSSPFVFVAGIMFGFVNAFRNYLDSFKKNVKLEHI